MSFQKFSLDEQSSTYLDEGISGRRFKDFLEITDTEAKCHKHNESKRTIEAQGCKHYPRNRLGCIADFLRHVHDCIWADERQLYAEDANQSCKTGIVPIASVIENGEHIVCRGMGCECPERHYNGNKAEEMK